MKGCRVLTGVDCCIELQQGARRQLPDCPAPWASSALAVPPALRHAKHLRDPIVLLARELPPVCFVQWDSFARAEKMTRRSACHRLVGIARKARGNRAGARFPSATTRWISRARSCHARHNQDFTALRARPMRAASRVLPERFALAEPRTWSIALPPRALTVRLARRMEQASSALTASSVLAAPSRPRIVSASLDTTAQRRVRNRLVFNALLAPSARAAPQTRCRARAVQLGLFVVLAPWLKAGNCVLLAPFARAGQKCPCLARRRLGGPALRAVTWSPEYCVQLAIGVLEAKRPGSPAPRRPAIIVQRARRIPQA